MKQLTAFILILFCSSGWAQLKPLAGVELYSSNTKVMRSQYGESKYDSGAVSLIYGLAYKISPATLSIKAITWMNSENLLRYSPTYCEYVAAAACRFKHFSVKLEHMCAHPIENYKTTRVKYFAGYTKLGLYYNINE